MNLLAGLMASKAAKIGTGVVAGGSSLAIVVNLLMSRLDNMDKRIDEQVTITRQYVDAKHESVMSEIKHISQSQSEIKDLLKVIDSRLYNQRNK